MISNETHLIYGQIHALLLLLVGADRNTIRSTKSETKVCYEELRTFLILLKGLNQNEIHTTREEAKDFYFVFLNLVERLIKFNEMADLEYMIDPLRKAWSTEIKVISVVYVFDNSESSRMFFIERLEEITEEINTQEYQSMLQGQSKPNFQGLRLGWL